MAFVFITGSADGLGQLAAQELVRQGHKVVLHARNENRAKEALVNVAGAEEVLVADLSDLNQVKDLALQANGLGRFDAVIHNAGVYRTSGSTLFNVNVLAPYVLTWLMALPERLIYLSSDMHSGGRPLTEVPDLDRITYSDSKLHITTLMKAVARYFPAVYSNAVDPGWVPTRMGGSGATDDLRQGYLTQAWLAVSDDERALVSGGYFYHRKQKVPNGDSNDIVLQDKLLEICGILSGVALPRARG